MLENTKDVILNVTRNFWLNICEYNAWLLISLKASSAINRRTRMMLHSQARVIVLIILPEMQLIKKENTDFPWKFLHSL